MTQLLNQIVPGINMNSQSYSSAPLRCNQATDLLPFIHDCISKATESKGTFYSSITFGTNFSDPLAILEQIYKPDQSICYYEKPTDEFSVACGNPITLSKFTGTKRFNKAKEWATKIFLKTFVAGNHQLECSGPTLFTNATFEDQSSDPQLPSLEIFLPNWQIVRKRGSHLIIINTKIEPESDAEQTVSRIKNLLARFQNLHDQRPTDIDPHKFKLSLPSENNDYEQAVQQALNRIAEGEISKIVLARKISYTTDRKLPVFSIAHSLRNKFPDCHTFCISTPDKGMFIGSTPETISRFSGTILETEAVAGTAPRGPSAGKDAHFGKTLLGREKEVLEHRLVIDSMLRRLKASGISDCSEGQTRLLRLANLQHVRTPLRAKLPEDIHPFDALAALHPTPAMGGSPREHALPLIAELEGFQRGLYAGITGWFDSRGRGEFMVPIRCGKIIDNSLTLFAGAGIVEGSIPANERAETDWKLEAMLEVIQG